MRHLTMPIPLVGDVATAPIAALLAHPALARLNRCRQLGGAWIVFPGATHTRFEHSLGVYAHSAHRAQLWLNNGWITRQDATDLAIYGLLHDWRHNPYSHLTDPLCTHGHNERGQLQFPVLRQAVEQCGGNWERINRLFTDEQDPLSQAVRNHPVGTDKLDYLERDAHHTAALSRPHISPFLQHTHLHNGQLCVDIAYNELLILLREQYVHAYRNLYFHPQLMVIDRYLQKMLAELMFPHAGSPELTEDELQELCDGDLDHRLATSSCTWVRQGFNALVTHRLPEPIIVLCHGEDVTRQALLYPNAKVVAVNDDILHRLQFDTCGAVQAAEASLADAARLPEHDLMLIPCKDRRRLILPDVFLVGDADELVLFSELNLPHWEAQAAAAQTFQTVQVCVTPTRPHEVTPAQCIRILECLTLSG